ncbi:PAS domain S-box protein [Mariniflexile litorale]|uniref:histidine kinase n=1 Tax=Mariniflexile litorale TaxID=3045158 RepID=A0AAU7EIM4_9FLAO|nr:PAS domain S-box protein [Mariniflexile sp. KMM 9835]MDQ8213251.1 PAS domain-containing protein [Mariniflexile sp. KMM 9835]
MSIETREHNFFQEGGEMGKLIRAKDWSKTPLGHPDIWPQPLRTMISVMLDNPFGMYIAWGKEYTQIYNDGYRPILGATKHPEALGISSRETFSEIWHIIGSMFDGVMDGIPIGFPDFMLPLNRNGYVENCYFDFAYSPIRLDNGEVGGVLVTVIETTDKKKAIEDLKESEERFRTMAEGTDIFISVGDENSRTTYFNNAWVKLTGRSMEELLKLGWLDLIHPEDREQYVNIYLNAFQKREPFTGEFRILNSEGKYSWLLAQGPPRFRSDGSFAGYISSCVDITDQKTFEIELQENKDQLEFAIDSTELGTWDYNPISNKFSANDRLKEWFGLRNDKEIDLRDALVAIEENDKQRVTNAIQKALEYASGGVYDIEFSILHIVTKQERIVHAKGRVWFNEEKVAYRLNGTLEDITEKTIANKKTKETELHIRTMVSESPIGICVIDATTLISEIVNNSFIEIAGKPREEIIGKFYWDTFAEVRSYYETALSKVIETGNPFYANEEELRLIRHGKEEIIYVTFVYAPLKDEKGKVVKVAVWVLENTLQVEARKKITISENNLRLMILQAPVAISILRGDDYKVEIANKYALELWGRLEEEVMNISIFDSMPELSTQGIKELLDDVAHTGKRFESPELPIQLVRNGILETVYINFSYEALYDAEGKINGIMSIGFDITSQVKARKNVEESEKRYHNLIYSSPSAIGILYGDNLIITIANDPILEIWGKGREIMGKPYFDALPELATQGYKEIFAEVYTTGVPFNAVETPVHIIQEGKETLKYYNFLVYAQKNIEGKVDGVGIIATEVTSQALLNNKIKESEQSIRALVESAPFPIGVFVGEEMRISLANQSIIDAWGKGSDVVGKLYRDILPEFGNQQIFEQIRRVLQTGIPFHAKNQKVDIVKNQKLSTFYYNYSFTPLMDSSGNAYAVMNTAAEVTELHEAKQKVEESEKRFRDSVKQAPLGITIFRGPDYVVEMANENYLLLVDKTEAQFVGKPLFETLPEVKETLVSIIAEIYKTGEAYYGYEFPIKLNRHGKIEDTYFNFVYHPLKENNVISGIMAVATEVTATVKAKHLIEENEEKLNVIIDASELGVWEYDLKTSESVTSNRFLDIFGFPRENHIPHKHLVSRIHPDDLAIRKAAFERSFETGILHYEARLILDDKSLRWIEVKGKVFYDVKKNPDRLIGTIRDISEERNSQQMLIEREQKFRLLANSMPQHIWTSDPEGNLNYFNQSVYDFSGITQEDIDKEGWIQIVHPDDKEENIKQWNESIKTGKDFLIEHRFRKHTGEYRWQLSRAIPQKDNDGVIKMWVGTSTDIQEQKMFTNELEKQVQQRTGELNQKNIDLEKMNKELQSFVYISSHDLQEPLRKIQTFASRILETEYATLSENAKKHFNRMQESANRMQNLIQDLFAYSRTNVEERKFEIVNLSKIVEEIKETLKEELEEKNVTIELINIYDIKIIPFQFKQLMINLVSNSIKFSRIATPLHIKIDCIIAEGSKFDIDKLSAKKKYCHISISDNGIGFEQQYSEKIFDVFQRLHGKEEYTGTGIGLAIVKKIVENHGGIILAKGELNHGATFNIYIPV